MVLKKLVRRSLRLFDKIFWTDYDIRLTNHIIGFHKSAYNFKKNKISFVHIPKTGGTSLHKLLRKDVKSRFINLNVHRPVSRLCDPGEYSYMTVMRNPVARVWSYYQMIKRNPYGSAYKRFADKGIECLLKHCWEVRNMACRYYSGEVKPEPDTATFNRAMKNLDNFICVIDMEFYEKQVDEFLTQYNIPNNHIPHERKSRYPTYDQNEYELICEYNKLDIEIFDKWKPVYLDENIKKKYLAAA